MARDSVTLTVVSQATKSRDLAFRETRVLQAIEKYCREFYDGGHTDEWPVEVRDHSDIVPMTGRGDARLDSTPAQDVAENLSYSRAMAVKRVTCFTKELLENSGRDKRVDLWASRTRRAMADFMRAVDKYLVHYDVADANGVKLRTAGFNTYDATIAGTLSYGFLEDIAEASQDAVVGGLSKATYSDLRNYFETIGGAFGTNGIAILAKVATETSEYVGDRTKQVLFMSTAMSALYLKEISGNVYIVGGDKGDVLPGSIWVNGIQAVTTGNLGYTGGNAGTPVSGMLINFGNYKFRTQKDTWFTAQPEQMLVDQMGKHYPIVLWGQLECIDNQRGSALIVNGEA